ncbi:MAG: SURF1 family protein [Gammaproteobacteria bacterium]
MNRPPLWAVLVTVAAVASFSALGLWQVRRGLAKEQMLAQLSDRATEPELLSRALGAPLEKSMRRAQASGRYLAGQSLLQDGQSHQHRPGYHVWTPLLLADQSTILVNRGWIPADRAGFDGSAPAGTVTVTGIWRAMPRPGVRLEGAANCGSEARFPVVVLYPTAEEVECLLRQPFVGGLLLLDPEAAGGFVREWTDLGFPPQRHYGYAVQWFALAIAAIVVFGVVNRRRPA